MLLVRGADKEVKNYNSQSPFQVEWRKKNKKQKQNTICLSLPFSCRIDYRGSISAFSIGKTFFLFFCSNTFPPSHLLPWQQCKMVKVSCNQGSQLSLWPILDLFHLNSIKWGNQNWASSRDSVSLLSQYRSSSLSGCLYTCFKKSVFIRRTSSLKKQLHEQVWVCSEGFNKDEHANLQLLTQQRIWKNKKSSRHVTVANNNSIIINQSIDHFMLFQTKVLKKEA